MAERRLSALLIPRRMSLPKDQALASIYGSCIVLEVDGQPQERVVAYDAEQGWVLKQRMIGDKVCLSNGSVMLEKVQGNLTLSWRLTPSPIKSYSGP